MVTERYPDLKANEGFRDLQAQLEGTENRIAVAEDVTLKLYRNIMLLFVNSQLC